MSVPGPVPTPHAEIDGKRTYLRLLTYLRPHRGVFGLGMLGVIRLCRTFILSWTTGSGLSICLVGIFGFSFSCCCLKETGWGFISRNAFEVSL